MMKVVFMKMKNLVLTLCFGILSISSARAGEINLNRGESMVITVKGCSEREDSILQSNGKIITALCLPKSSGKVCMYRTYWGIYKMEVRLSDTDNWPSSTLLGKYQTKAEGHVAIQDFIKQGICEKAEYAPIGI